MTAQEYLVFPKLNRALGNLLIVSCLPFSKSQHDSSRLVYSISTLNKMQLEDSENELTKKCNGQTTHT